MSSGSYLNAAAIYTKVEAVTSSHVSAGFYFYTDNGSDFNPRMTLSKDGVLTVPNIYSNTISTRAVYVDSSGNLGTTSSSRRTKYEIKNLTDTSANLLDCQPVSFRYKKTGDVDVGLIAEDVDAAGCKGLVGYDETGKPDYLKYEKIGVYLIPIIKAQQVKIIELEARLQALEDKLKQESVNEICE
jgi:hypothetical protein